MSSNPIRKSGITKLNHEITELKRQRIALADKIAQASSKGDLSENAEYHAAKEEQAKLEANLSRLSNILNTSYVVENSDKSKVAFGVTVKLKDLDNDIKRQYTIVGEHEADLNNNLISIKAPIARALLDKKRNDIVEVSIPKGVRMYMIEDILIED